MLTFKTQGKDSKLEYWRYGFNRFLQINISSWITSTLQTKKAFYKTITYYKHSKWGGRDKCFTWAKLCCILITALALCWGSVVEFAYKSIITHFSTPGWSKYCTVALCFCQPEHWETFCLKAWERNCEMKVRGKSVEFYSCQCHLFPLQKTNFKLSFRNNYASCCGLFLTGLVLLPFLETILGKFQHQKCQYQAEKVDCTLQKRLLFTICLE